MGFEFKPSIWFVCRICRKAFQYLYQLKEHKLECHLGECLKTKCLIFEERCLDHEWIPSTKQLQSPDGPFSSIADFSNRGNSYKNPYVSLQRLAPQQLDISRNKLLSVSTETGGRRRRGIKRSADKLATLPPPDVDEPYTEKKYVVVDVEPVEITASLAPQQIVFDSEVPKIELKIEDLNQVVEDTVFSPSASNLVSTPNTDDVVNENAQAVELEDREFIVASIVQSSDGTGNIQFVTTHIPPTAPEIILRKPTEKFRSVLDRNDDSEVLDNDDTSVHDLELPSESEIHAEVTSDVLELKDESYSDADIIETESSYENDYDSIIDLPPSEESVSIETVNTSLIDIFQPVPSSSPTSSHESSVNEVEVIDSNLFQETPAPRLGPSDSEQQLNSANQDFPTVTLTSEELSLPLVNWLTREKSNNPSNVILLDPNPSIETAVVDATIILPIKCVLCKLELTSDSQVKEHVRMCWTFNKERHLYCVPCKKSYAYLHGLKRHCSTVHKSLVTPTESSGIVEAADVTDATAENINLIQEPTETGPQTNSDSCNNTVLEDSLPASSEPQGSRYNIRRNRSKVNYSETQACKGCARDFLTVEDVERHEKLCPQLRPNTIRCKGTNNKEAVDDEIQVIRSTTKKTSTKEIISDDESYASPDNSESDRGTDNEMDDSDNGWRPRAPGPKKSRLPTVRLTPDDLSLPLVDWLAKEKISDPSNLILLDPDPATQATPVDVHPLRPIKCVLCNLVLTAEAEVKEHVRVCWNYNESQRVYCVPCQWSYAYRKGLQEHNKKNHKSPNQASPTVTLTSEEISLSLLDWITKEKASDPSNVIVLDPDPTKETLTVAVSDLNRMKCVLCKVELTSDTQVKEHVKICWNLNKARHLYCVPCKKSFTYICGYKGHYISVHNYKPRKTSTASSRMAEAAKAIGAKVEDIMVASDEENYESSDSSKSGTLKKTSLSPSVKLTPEDLSLPLLDWLTREKAKDSSNVILLDPDLGSESVTVAPDVSDSNPVTCVLCNLKLTSETEVKKHVKKCWRLNKRKRIYCLPCKRSFPVHGSLPQHRKDHHKLLTWFSRRHCTVVLIPRKYNEPLKEWLAFQKQGKHSDGSSNVILIDRDPTLSDLDSADMVIDNGHPVTCLLCQMLLFSDPDVRNHVENCWWHNKDKHRRCVPCKYTFDTPKLLQEHQKHDHFQTQFERVPHTNNEDSDEDEVDTSNDGSKFGLCEWLKKRIEKSSNVILLHPDPTKATEPLTVSSKSPMRCMLCRFKLEREVQVRRHVQMCWRENKENHVYCIPCEQAFSDGADLNEHNCFEHFPGPEYPYNCTVCYAGFKDREAERKHRESLIEFAANIDQGQYTNNSIASNSDPTELRLGEWLLKQKEANPTNYIVLYPDPLSIDSSFEDVSDANPVACSLCERKFTVEPLLRSHVELCWTHNKRNHRHCVPCEKTFSGTDRLKCHNKLVHCKGPRTTHKCNVCGKHFLSLLSYKNHVESHLNPDKSKPVNVNCKVCGMSFPNKSQLVKHDMVSHSSERQFKCPHCPSSFKTNTNLRLHLETHARKKHRVYKCKFCPKSYAIKEKFHDHERSHTGDRPFECQVAGCSQTFPSKASRFIHTRRKHCGESGVTQFLCPTCGRTFGLQSELDYHIQRFHTEAKDKPFKCPHEGCTKRFGMKFQIAPHMLIHTGEKAFQCEQCGRAFSTKQALKHHQLTHNDKGEGNEVTCNLCPKTFRGEIFLKRHLKSHEKRQKKDARSKFKCQFCGKGYSSKSSLNKHEETHEEDEEGESEEVEETESESEESTNESSEGSESQQSDGEEETEKDPV